MQGNWLKSLLVAVLALFFVPSFANDHEEKTKLDPAKLIMEHIQDAHEFHFFTLEKKTALNFTRLSHFL